MYRVRVRGLRPKILVAWPLLLVVPGCTPAGERSERAREAVHEAISQGDRERALEAIEDLREASDGTADGGLELARLLVRAGDAPEASWLLEDVLRRHPDRADLAIALGRVSLLLGNPARARELADQIPTGSERHPESLILRAQAELHLGDLERALATLTEAEERYPDRPEARLIRIATLLSERRRDEAREEIREARAALSGGGEEELVLRRSLDLTLAHLQVEQGDAAAALETVERLVRDDPGDLLAWRSLVLLLLREERPEEALARVREALADEDPPAELHALAALAHRALGEDETVEQALRDYAALSDSAAAYQPLVSLEASRDDAGATLAVLDEALSRHPDEPALRVQRTEALLALGDLEGARAERRRFRSASFDGDPQNEYLDARIALAEGDAEGAARRLTALAPRLDRASTHYWIGRALERSGDLDGARRRYGLAHRRDPAWMAPPSALLALEQRRGDWQAVATQARAVLAVAPREIGAWRALVAALEGLREGEEAEQVARECRERFPDRADPHILLARALRAQGRTDEALAALEAAGEYGAGAEVAAARVRTLGMAGRIEAGVEAGRAAVARYQEDAPVHAALASLLFASGAVAEGERATDRALALDPDEPAPLRERCAFRASTGRWAEARDDCTRYLGLRPEDAEVAFIRAVSLHQLGEVRDAIAAYRRAASLGKGDPRPRNNLAAILLDAGDVDGALEAAQEAHRLDETNPHVMDTLGALYLEKGLVDRAISVLEDAHRGAPGLAEAQLHLALAYREAGRTAEARRLLADLEVDDAARPELRASAREALDLLP